MVRRVKVAPPSVETEAAGDIDGIDVAASRVVVGNDDLVGVIRVSPSECLRLGNVGRGLGAGDQIDIRGAIQGHEQFFDSLA